MAASLQQDVTGTLPSLLSTSTCLPKSADLGYTAALVLRWQLEGTQMSLPIAENNQETPQARGGMRTEV